VRPKYLTSAAHRIQEIFMNAAGILQVHAGHCRSSSEKLRTEELPGRKMKSRKPCNRGIGPAFDVIGGKWKAAILWELHAQPRRFGELRRLLPEIGEKTLILQLRELEADGIVHREVFHEVPPRVEYSQTKLGATLHAALGPLADWGDRHARRVATARRQAEAAA
jgi:DNA-binding HxlR family transcriptional regulator